MKDTTTQALDSMVEIAIGMNEWDELPLLMFVSDAGNTLVALAGLDDVPAALPMIADRLKEGEVPIDLGEITGVILFCEAWSMSAKRQDADALSAEVQALREMGRRFSDHPDAVEIKSWYAIDSEGFTTQFLERGSAEPLEKESKGSTGRVVDGMKLIWEVVSA